ncbi:tubulin glycylase 3A isoform X1 [Leptinotarsa decemlineata]|uniref:tubulin glycylase 3A isoform X1 n=1 Tax=Leptinotarsa decemlineata TaxID=7539 RepID=UPI003D304F75
MDTEETTEENKQTNSTSQVNSAPSTSKLHTVTPEIQRTVNSCTKRSNSSTENRYKCAITSERLTQLRKLTETATRDHKVFTIKGGWPIIRKEMLKRQWLEKVDPPMKQKITCLDDVTCNLPVKQDWESQQTYVEKCEKTILSRMLQNHEVDFYWSMRKEPGDLQHRANTFKLINRFSRSLFASKEGLALLLQQSYWYTESGVASVNYPRVYVLGFPDHYNLFIDDFRLTACIGLLKWFAHKYETGDKHAIQSPDGRVSETAILFAIDRCNDYIASQKHLDIDNEFAQIWDHEWDQFFTHFHIILHQDGLFEDFCEPLPTVYANVKSTLKEMQKYWPQYDIDGMRNIWILKPGNKCRGRGIQLVKDITDVDKVMSLKMKYVVQKYIERPLIIYQTKFDIRQWFMVTCVQPLTIWMYRDSYLRFSSQIFNLKNFHESLHLTNYAIQCKYTNGSERDKALPDDNMWDCHTFKAYLKQNGCMDKWNEVIYPGMQQSIICTMLSSQDTMDRRMNTFEIYGADFMLSEDFRPWLLEINCSPDLSFSTSVTSRLCAQCMEDVIKVVIDRRRDPNADTGLFEMVYKQNFPRTPPYLGMNLSIRGRRIFRNRSRVKSESDKADREKALRRLRRNDFIKKEFMKDSEIKNILPKIIPKENYKGPVIADFIEDLKSLNDGKDSGVDFIPAIKSEGHKKKYEAKSERVSRKRNARESSRMTSRSSSSSCFGVSKELKMSCNGSSSFNDVWKEGTASILRGTNILNKGSDTTYGTDVNKNIFLSKNLNAFDLNSILRSFEK